MKMGSLPGPLPSGGQTGGYRWKSRRALLKRVPGSRPAGQAVASLGGTRDCPAVQRDPETPAPRGKVSRTVMGK